MDIYEFFAAYTVLPVPIDHVEEQVRTLAPNVSIGYFPVDTDPVVFAGICRIYRWRPPYAVDDSLTAQIIYSSRLDRPWQRLVICKELLHILDPPASQARTREEVSQLIDEVVIPESIAATAQVVSDRIGLLNALKVLLPRDALETLYELHDERLLSESDVATLAQIPLEFARVALTPMWRKILDTID